MSNKQELIIDTLRIVKKRANDAMLYTLLEDKRNTLDQLAAAESGIRMARAILKGGRDDTSK